MEQSTANIMYFSLAEKLYPESGYYAETGGYLANLRNSTNIKKVREYHKKFYRWAAIFSIWSLVFFESYLKRNITTWPPAVSHQLHHTRLVSLHVISQTLSPMISGLNSLHWLADVLKCLFYCHGQDAWFAQHLESWSSLQYWDTVKYILQS